MHAEPPGWRSIHHARDFVCVVALRFQITAGPISLIVELAFQVPIARNHSYSLPDSSYQHFTFMLCVSNRGAPLVFTAAHSSCSRPIIWRFTRSGRLRRLSRVRSTPHIEGFTVDDSAFFPSMNMRLH